MARIGSTGPADVLPGRQDVGPHGHDAEQQRVLGEVPAERLRADAGGPQQLRRAERVGGQHDDVGPDLLLGAGPLVAQDGADGAVALPDDPDAERLRRAA